MKTKNVLTEKDIGEGMWYYYLINSPRFRQRQWGEIVPWAVGLATKYPTTMGVRVGNFVAQRTNNPTLGKVAGTGTFIAVSNPLRTYHEAKRAYRYIRGDIRKGTKEVKYNLGLFGRVEKRFVGKAEGLYKHYKTAQEEHLHSLMAEHSPFRKRMGGMV